MPVAAVRAAAAKARVASMYTAAATPTSPVNALYKAAATSAAAKPAAPDLSTLAGQQAAIKAKFAGPSGAVSPANAHAYQQAMAKAPQMAAQVVSQNAGAALQPQIAAAVKSGNYAQAWQIASNNSTALSYLTNPQSLASMAGGQFTPQQSQAFYSAAVPYAANLIKYEPSSAPGTYYNAGGNAAQSTANITKQLQGLANGTISSPGGIPNIGSVAGSTATGGVDGFLGMALPVVLGVGATLATAGALAPAIGAIGAGALSGAVGSAVNTGASGNATTLGSVGKGAASGAIGGALTGTNLVQNATGAVQNATGLSTPLASGLVNGGVGAGIGATKSALFGGNPLTGAVMGGLSGAAQGAGLATDPLGKLATSTGIGALGGALSGQGAASGAASGALGATGAVVGSIFNSPGATVDPGLTQAASPNSASADPNNPNSALNSNYFSPSSAAGSLTSANNLTNGTPSMSANPFDPSFFDPSQQTPIPMDTGYGTYSPATDPNATNFNNTGNNAGTDTSLASLLGGVDPNYQASNQYLNQGQSGATGSAAGTAAGSTAASLLSRLLGGGGSSGSGGAASGGNTNVLGMLASLLGGGSGTNSLLSTLLNGGAGALNSQAAQYAANQYAGQTKFNPYSVNGAGGSTSFNGTTANQSLSPQSQQQFNNLGNLANSSAQSLQGGTAGAANQYYNQLQASQSDANNKMYQNNLDSQFANGVLSSTAGQYQSQAALANISNQQLQDHVLANNFANTQQQNQLGQLTAGLNGMNQIQQGQNQQLSTAGSLGNMASNNNLEAYKPLAGTNANSTLGGILGSIGNQASSSSSGPNLLQLLGLG